MEVKIDRGGCIACGLCVETCPAVFEIASDGLAQVVKQPENEEEFVRVAAEGCPVAVIHVEED